MKRKHSKKTGIIAAVVGLSSVALVSVGFASWVISGNDTTTLDGNIAVDTVEDGRYNILNKDSLKSNANNGQYNITFGQPSSMNTSGAWLTAKNGKTQVLSFTMKVYINNYNGNTQNNVAAGALTVTLAGKTQSDEDKYDAAVDHGVVKALPSVSNGGITVSAKTLDNDNESSYKGQYYSTVTVTFGWGLHFNYLNPYDYYNDGHHAMNDYVDGSSGDTWGDDAYEYLGYVHALENVKYTLTLATSQAS